MVNIAQVQEFVPVGGASVYRRIATAGLNEVNVKASSGRVYGWYIFNTAIVPRFLKLYNLGLQPLAGTDVPFMTIPIPAGGGATVWFAGGIAFPNGIGIAMTANAPDNDTTVVVAGDLVVNILYN